MKTIANKRLLKKHSFTEDTKAIVVKLKPGYYSIQSGNGGVGTRVTKRTTVLFIPSK